MTRGHFRAFLSLACGILQASKYIPYPILFSVSLVSLWPLGQVKKREQTLVHFCRHFFLAAQIKFPLFLFSTQGPKRLKGENARKRT